MAGMVVLWGCAPGRQEFEAAGTAMGTVIQQKIYGEEDLTEEISAEIVRLETEHLSKREENSEIGRINLEAGNPQGTVLSEEMSSWLFRIWNISRDSGGAMDVTVGPIVRLWNIDNCTLGTEEFSVPSEQDIERAVSLTGYEKVILEEDAIFLPEGRSLDLGAVGTGIACDRIAKLLAEHEQVDGAVISVGGSIVTYGEKPDHSPWIIGIQNPRPQNGGDSIGRLSLEGTWFVSTSGDYERYVLRNGKRYHHIMNALTGCPAETDVVSVTILSDSGLLSDALSTACFVLGKEEGFLLAEKYGVEILTVDEEGNIEMSEGMKQYFSP